MKANVFDVFIFSEGCHIIWSWDQLATKQQASYANGFLVDNDFTTQIILIMYIIYIYNFFWKKKKRRRRKTKKSVVLLRFLAFLFLLCCFRFVYFFSGSFWPNMMHFLGCFRKFVVLLYFCFPYRYICYTKQIRIAVGKLSNFADFKVCHRMVIYKGFS